MNTFVCWLSPFSRLSFQSSPHSEDLFPFLEIQRFTIDSIYGLLLLSRARHDSIERSVFNFVISSSIYIRTPQTSYSKKDILHSAP